MLGRLGESLGDMVMTPVVVRKVATHY